MNIFLNRHIVYYFKQNFQMLVNTRPGYRKYINVKPKGELGLTAIAIFNASV